MRVKTTLGIRPTMGMGMVAASLLTAPLALAQVEPAPEAPPRQTMIAWEHEAPAAWFPDAMDAGLVRAGSMIPERLREIFELEEFAELRRNVPWPLVEAAIARLGGSMRFVATQQGFDPDTGAPQVGVILSFRLEGGVEEATELHNLVEQVRMQHGLQMEIQPSARFAGMNEMQLPFGKLAYGPRAAADGQRYEIHFGAAPDPDDAFEALPEQAGIDIVARGILDFAAAAPFTNMGRGMLGMLGEQGAALEQTLVSQGVFGESAIAIEYASGYTETHGVESIRVKRAAQYAEGLGLSQMTISREDLAAIPADASFAWVGKSDPEKDLEQFMTAMAPYMRAQKMSLEDIFAEIEMQTGVNVQEFVAAFGDTWAFYLSDSTGGGALLSGAFVTKVEDAATIRDTFARLGDMANQAIAGEIDTQAFAVRFTQFEHGGAEFTQLRFPGLPVPFEPTLALTGGWLVAGLTPQAAAGAVRQIEQGGPTLADNASFQADDIALGKITELAFVDAARTIRDGYPAMTLVSSALSNFVRSPTSQRDPGLILPPYAELVEGARPMVMTSFWDGDDYITRWTGDRSTLVNAAAILGVGDLGSFLGGALIGSGITGGALQKNMRQPDWEMEIEDEDEPGF